MTDLKVGDRVRLREKPDKLGTVKAIDWDGDPPERAESCATLELVKAPN